MAAEFCLMVAVCLLIVAAASDIASRSVPNWLSLLLGFDGFALQVQSGLHALPYAMLAMVIVFVLAVWCWRRGVMGGGDVKLLAAVSLLVQPAAVLMLLVAIALSGGVLGLIYWVMPRVLSKPGALKPTHLFGRIVRVEHYRICRGFSVPYAVAIAAGAAFLLRRGFAA